MDIHQQSNINTHHSAHILSQTTVHTPSSTPNTVKRRSSRRVRGEQILAPAHDEPPPRVDEEYNTSQTLQTLAPHAKYRKEKRFKGIPASPGILIGNAVILAMEAIAIKDAPISEDRIEPECARFAHAVEECTQELHRIITMANDEAPVAAPILEAQLFILNDPSVAELIAGRIRSHDCAELAVQTVFDSQQAIMRHASDSYLRERAVDLENVKQRLLNFLTGRNTVTSVQPQGIVISDSLTPSDVMLFRKSGMTAFATETSGITSHAAILARSLGLPAVVGLANICKRISTDTTIIIDGFAGIIISNPHPDTIAKYERRQEDLVNHVRKLGKLAHLPAQTTDGRKVHLHANADTPEEIDLARASGAEGVGLIRTELQILTHNFVPDEDEQTAYYKELAERAYPLPITLRAFDIGSDKSFGLIANEPNPALGLRGLRFLLKNKAIFIAQIRAMLRASCHRNVRLMLPMITTIQEFQKALSIIEQCKATLRENGEAFDAKMPIGAMIETPAAALIARELGALADFFSIGTNDLTQYTLATDRMNASTTQIYDTFHPAILRLLKMIVDAANFNNIPVAVCGEFASHAAATELLIGLGIEELSVAPSSLLELKKRIRKTAYTHTRDIAGESLHFSTSSEVRKYLTSSAL
jgi:phosphotransferase system enzyme I (PtsI)